ncbi:MAG: phospholipase [Alphaproteobacteria bacterium]|nr:phospholipase [Alphaproteobacteria bacterium]MDE2013057.1 phospholipase [Alphaproteobacteria bacterium]
MLTGVPDLSPDWLETLVALAYALAALAVTVHVLLTKRDVRAALGWIALAWLTPAVGALIYYGFGINRVSRRATRIGTFQGAPAPAVPAPPALLPEIADLAAIVGRVTGHALAPGNAVALFRGGDEAYPAMLAAIHEARHSIALASYIFRGDRAGQDFIDALAGAQERGVAVRVLIDSVGSGYVYSSALRRLHARGVPAARFLHTWLPWRMPFLNLRNHKKLLIVDGAIGFTGGLNIGNEYAATLARGDYADDVHICAHGPITRQFMESFAQDWAFTTGETLDQEIWWPPLAQTGSVCARAVRSGPDTDIGKLEAILGAALAQARSRVRIVTPYFLPDQKLQFAIAQAALRGVAVEILIPEHCDSAFIDWAMRAHIQFLSEAPDLVRVCPAPFDHAKLMTVDGEWCLVGSSNWDTRSLRLNFELDVECYDRALTGQIDALIDGRLARSRPLGRAALAARPVLMRLRDAAARLFLPYL